MQRQDYGEAARGAKAAIQKWRSLKAIQADCSTCDSVHTHWPGRPPITEVMMDNDISTDELKEAYRSAELWRIGISYRQAITTPSVLRSMTNQVKAWRRHNNRPVQAILELEPA